MDRFPGREGGPVEENASSAAGGVPHPSDFGTRQGCVPCKGVCSGVVLKRSEVRVVLWHARTCNHCHERKGGSGALY